MTVINPSTRTSGRKRIGALAAAIALLGALLAVGGSVGSASADGTGSITGTVQGAGSPNSALLGATVQLYRPGLDFVSTAVTDEAGDFSFAGVSPGSYTLDVQAPDGDNFVQQWWNGKPDYNSADYFSLAAGQSLNGLNVVLAVGSTLSGSVLGAGDPNVPLQGAYVSLSGPNGFARIAGFADANGNFKVNAIGAGTYTVQFDPPFGSSKYIPQWWQNQSAPQNAQTITVGVGQTLTGYNAVLPLAASISGSVVGADTLAGLSGATVEALQDGNYGGHANVGADGSYVMQGMVPGAYTLEFLPAYGQNYLPQYWNDQPTKATANTITVAGGEELTGINATLAVGASISGVVTTAESPEAGFADTSAFAVDGTGQIVGSTTTAQDGSYSIVGLSSATYRIEFLPPFGDSHALQYWKNAKTFDKATRITVAGSAAITGINATLTQGASISGTVSEAADPSVPVPYADVWAQSPSGTMVANAFADESGNYTLMNLPVGTFVVKFAGSEDVAYTPSWWKNATKLSAATRIKVTAGSAITGINGAVARAYLAPGHPAISGSAKVGSTLTAKPGKWKPSGTTFTYQWNRDGSAIAGATNATYSPVNADAGHSLTVSVTGDYFNYDERTVTSAATKAVTGGTLTTAVPQITGTPTRGSVLTAVGGTWGPGDVTLTYRWSRGGSKISGATASTYTVTKADAGKRLTVTVTGSEPGFATASQTSIATALAS